MEKFTDGLNEDTTRFDLSTENELLKLKLQAEFGAECPTGEVDLPDGVVHDFLQSVYLFEKQYRSGCPSVKILEKIGTPELNNSALLSDGELYAELRKIIALLHQHNIHLEFKGSYPARIIYDFIVGEFVEVEMDDIRMPGFIHQFYYEDFHVNHELEVKQIVLEFLSAWFAGKIESEQNILSNNCSTPDHKFFSRSEVLRRIANIYESYHSYQNCEYLFNAVSIEWNNDEGKAVAKGKVRYDAKMENNEPVHIEGAFEFHLSIKQNDWWVIYYFVFPGFEWRPYIRLCD